MDVRIHGRPITFTRGSTFGATYVDESGSAYLLSIGTDAETGNATFIALVLPQDQLKRGELAFHGYETYGIVSVLEPEGMRLVGVIGQGSIRFDEVGRNAGDAIRGAWTGMIAPQPLPE